MNAKGFFEQQDLNAQRKSFTKDDVVIFAELYHEAKKAEEKQFEALCNADLYEMSANAHFESERLPDAGKTMTAEGKCQAGCNAYTGNEIHHHKDCIFYPNSLSKELDELRTEFRQEVSDEEIEKEAHKHFTDDAINANVLWKILGFKRGANWMRNRMKGGNQ
jgi:hypothetical protein